MYVLTQLIDFCTREKSTAVLTYIDYVTVFDTVSHNFLDGAFRDTGATDKTRAVYRSI